MFPKDNGTIMWNLHIFNADIFFGYGSIDKLKDIELKDPIIVTAKSLVNTELISKISEYTNSKKIMIGPSQHTPEEELKRLEPLLNSKYVISVGGGSIIDAVKLSNPYHHLAIPTTLSGAEHTGVAGFTKDGIKLSKKVRPPDTVILDPNVFVNTPDWLLYTTAFRALDHAIEAIYSIKASLLTDALSIQGYKYLTKCLEKKDLLQCQIGVLLSSKAFMYAGAGLSHVFGYIFGPAFNIPHGVTSCISLVQAIIFNMPNVRGRLDLLDTDVVGRLNYLMEKLNINEKLSKYASLEDALKMSTLLVNLVNNSENPRKLTKDSAEMFIKSLF
jgi:maleylacetate reductase